MTIVHVSLTFCDLSQK